MSIDWNSNIICSLLDGVVPVIVVGIVIWLYQRKIEKKDKEEQKYIERRTKLEEEFYDRVKCAKRDFLLWSQRLLNGEFDVYKNSKLQESLGLNIQTASDMIDIDPHVLGKYRQTVSSLLSEHKKLPTILHMCTTNDEAEIKQLHQRVNLIYDEYNKISCLYYGSKHHRIELINRINYDR